MQNTARMHNVSDQKNVIACQWKFENPESILQHSKHPLNDLAHGLATECTLILTCILVLLCVCVCDPPSLYYIILLCVLPPSLCSIILHCVLPPCIMYSITDSHLSVHSFFQSYSSITSTKAWLTHGGVGIMNILTHLTF